MDSLERTYDQQAPTRSRIFNPGIFGDRIQGFFGERISLKFLSKDSTKKYPGLPSQLIDLVSCIHFGRLICWWKIHDESLPLLALFGQGLLSHHVAIASAKTKLTFYLCRVAFAILAFFSFMFLVLKLIIVEG